MHGHCHQKAFDAFSAVETVLKLVPDLKVEPIESSCCGMAGSFGYAADTIDVSLAMGELSLLPAVRKADADTLIVADGTSCRHQIHDGTGREAIHVARVLAMSLPMTAVMPRESGASRRAGVSKISRTTLFTGSAAFADDDSPAGDCHATCRCCRPRWSAPTPSRNG